MVNCSQFNVVKDKVKVAPAKNASQNIVRTRSPSPCYLKLFIIEPVTELKNK